jgi:PhnB protein
MSPARPHIRHGFGAVRPCLYGHADLPDFVREVFEAEELGRTAHRHGGCNVEMRVDDAVLVLETAPPSGWQDGKPRGVVCVYVRDTDAAYARALRRGAGVLMEPQDRPWGDRVAGVADPFGNTWWIATHAHRCV